MEKTTKTTLQTDRLKRLDQEMAIERSKDFEYVFAVRGDHRFKVAVFRNGRNGFAATCKIGGYLFKYNGELPSRAFAKLSRSLARLASQMDYQRKIAIYESNDLANPLVCEI